MEKRSVRGGAFDCSLRPHNSNSDLVGGSASQRPALRQDSSGDSGFDHGLPSMTNLMVTVFQVLRLRLKQGRLAVISCHL
jgi:hypothetical protein